MYEENVNIRFEDDIDIEHLKDIISQLLSILEIKVDKSIENDETKY